MAKDINKPNIVIRFLEHKATKITMAIIFALSFLTLLACSITYFVFTQQQKEMNPEFQKVWAGILAVLTVLNTPLTVLKMQMLIRNQILHQRKRALLMKEYYEKMKKGEIMHTNGEKALKDYKKSLTPIERIELFSANNGRKIEGKIYYELLPIINNSDLNRKDKIDLATKALLDFYPFDKEALERELKAIF